MPLAVATALAIGVHDAEIRYPHGMANLNSRLLGFRDRLDRPSRTDFGALRTFGTAVASIVAHHGLHQGHQVTRRAQHMILAHRDTQLATGAMLRQVLEAQRTRRSQR